MNDEMNTHFKNYSDTIAGGGISDPTYLLRLHVYSEYGMVSPVLACSWYTKDANNIA